MAKKTTKKIVLLSLVILASVSVVISGGVIFHQARKLENSPKTELKKLSNQTSKKQLSNSQQVAFLPKPDKEIGVNNSLLISPLKTNELLISPENSQNIVDQTPQEENSPNKRRKDEELEKPNRIPPVQPSPNRGEKKSLEIEKGKFLVPQGKWLDTYDQLDIVQKLLSSSTGLEYFNEITKKGIAIQYPGTYWGLFLKDNNQKKDLKELEKQKDEPAGQKEASEIIFNFVNVNAYHFSLLVYKKGDNLWRHYDSLGVCNFNHVKSRTINNENLVAAPCPQQPDGWSCGIYPPVIFSILLKRYKNNQLNNAADWEINQAEFLAERDKIMDIV